MKIDMFKNTKSQYEVLAHFTRGFQEALKRAKIESDTYDIQQQPEEEILANFVKKPPDFTAGFNFLISEHSFLEPLGIPHISLIVDNATYYPMLINLPHTLACFVEQDSCEFIRLFGHTKTMFLPHAIEAEMVSSTLDEEIIEAKRDFEIVLTASFIDADELFKKWQMLFSKKAVQFLDDIAESTLASRNRCHTLACLQDLQANQEVVEEIKEKELPIFDIINSIEKVIRGRDKIRLVNALSGSDFHIFGAAKDEEGWRGVCKNKKGFVFHEAVPFKKLFELYKRSKIVVNSMSTIKNGFHERIFYALAAGASVLTNENALVPSAFEEGKALLYFLAPKYADIPLTINAALLDEKSRLADVFKARERVRASHTWDTRVKMLLDAVFSLQSQKE